VRRSCGLFSCQFSGQWPGVSDQLGRGLFRRGGGCRESGLWFVVSGDRDFGRFGRRRRGRRRGIRVFDFGIRFVPQFGVDGGRETKFSQFQE
jgi:hypothetical protein